MANGTVPRGIVAIVVFLVSASSAHGAPGDPIGGGGPGGGGGDLSGCGAAHATLTANPNPVQYGRSSTLSWTVQLPSTCTEGSLQLDGVPVGVGGSKQVTPISNAGHSLTLTATAARTSLLLAYLELDVQLPPVVDISDSAPAWRSLLIQAVNTPGETVRVAPNVDMDMTGRDDLYIAQGVRLLGGQPCQQVSSLGARTTAGAAGSITDPPLCGGHDAMHPGPRLYTNSRPNPLFKMNCTNGNMADNVRIAGLRIEGPDVNNDPDTDDNLEKGLEVDSCLNIDISNMELSGWSGAAIYLVDPAQRIINPETIHIHDNFIHHNQHISGNGYGVDVETGAWATIEHNVFDFNRHALTASGAAETGYLANQNLVLKGGGYNGSTLNQTVQQFDVHGDRNCYEVPGIEWTYHLWNCGSAGSQFWFTNNAFQYTTDWAIHIRGTPRIGVWIDNNVFAHSTPSGAIQADGNRVDVGAGLQANTFGFDSYGNYGSCDFDGDGKDDLFLATGASWWYMSTAKGYWSYLNGNTERLNQVALGDFDGDGRCDVFTVHGNDWVVSDGGRGAWRSLGSFGIPFDQLAFGDFNGDGIKDIFRRAPDGQWSAISPGHYDWTMLQSSSLPLGALRFGDFNHDRVTDVIALEEGHWSVSWGGRSVWMPLNPNLSNSLDTVLIADLDHNGSDDVIQYTPNNATEGTWSVSWDGRSTWQTLASENWPSFMANQFPAFTPRAFMVRSITPSPAGSDLVILDSNRLSWVYNKNASGGWAPYGDYAY